MTEQNFSSMRAAMVESQLRTSDVDDQRVIAAMAHVAREEFVPAERRAMAYVDRPVPLAGGRALNPPLVTGRLLKEAQIAKGDRTLNAIAAAQSEGVKGLLRLLAAAAKRPSRGRA